MIRLTRRQLSQIETAGERAYPAEACGLLAGQDSDDNTIEITRVVESPNLRAAETNDRFEIDPQVHFDLLRELRGTAERVVGHYHSHPDHSAEPSPRDLEMVVDGGMIWLVTSVSDGHADETTAHRLNSSRDAFIQIPLDIVK